MIQGECAAVNESEYFARTKNFGETVFNSLTIAVSTLGLALNILSLVVFVRVSNKSGSRNSFHLFLVFLSVCEVSFCLTSAVTYTIMTVSMKGFYRWTGLNALAEANQTLDFAYSLYMPTESIGLTTLVYNLLTLFAYLSVVSQFSRNCWVAITALLRCYVATRRTSVQVSQMYTLRRISLLFALKLILVVSLSLTRSYLINAHSFLSLEFHACNTSGWQRRGILLLHVMLNKSKHRDTVNMYWTLLSQTIPLVAIITSSILLVVSLRSNSMVNSSERNKKITRMVFIFSLTFALLEGPRAIVFFVFKYYSSAPRYVAIRLFQVTYILSVTDSIVNVFIYFFNDQHFKKELCGEAKPKMAPSLTETVRLIETTRQGEPADPTVSGCSGGGGGGGVGGGGGCGNRVCGGETKSTDEIDEVKEEEELDTKV